MEDDELKRARAPLLVSGEDMGRCQADLMRVAIQGVRPDNMAARGGIAVGMRRAAWRVQHGSLDGFDEAEDRLHAKPAEKALDYDAKGAAGAVYELINKVQRFDNANIGNWHYGEIEEDLQKIYGMLVEPKGKE